MLELSSRQICALAGTGDTDSEFERDLKIAAWLGNRTFRVISNSPLRDREVQDAIRDGIDVLITEEK